MIYVFSSQKALPGPNDVFFNFVFKKCAHIFVYAGLYFWIFRGLALTLNHHNHAHTIYYLPLVLSVAYALTDEFHQSLVLGRTATLRDIGYDFLGASIAMFWKFKVI